MIGSGIFLMSIVIVVWGLIRCGIFALENAYLLNIGMELIGMIIGFVLFVSCVTDIQKSIVDTQMFVWMIFAAHAGLFFDAVSWMVDGHAAIRPLIILINTCYYLCAPIQAYLFWRYLRIFLRRNSFYEKTIDRMLNYGLWISIAVRIINLFTGIYFTVDNAGVYHRSRFFFISSSYQGITLLLALIAIFQERTHLQKVQRLIMYSYVIVPLAATILTIRAYGLSVGPASLMCELLLMYCVVNVEQGREKALAEQDMKTATRIQANMLPNIFPAFSNRTDFDVYASMNPAKEVGGDFYDFFLIDDDHLAMVIADVSGKGVPAALFMMVSMILMNNTTCIEGADASPGEVLTKVNDAICANNSEEMFVTAWLGILDLRTGKVIASNAGHEYPILKGASGKFEVMKDRHGIVIGAFEGIRYRDYEFTMERGNTLFLYTDGVAEATNKDYELYGIERIVNTLNEDADATPRDLLRRVKASVDQFVGDAPQFDDLTMLAVKLS